MHIFYLCPVLATVTNEIVIQAIKMNYDYIMWWLLPDVHNGCTNAVNYYDLSCDIHT